MKKNYFILALTIIFMMGVISSVSAQGKMGRVGKLFSKSEAEILFGKVHDSYQISKSDLKKLLSKTGDYLLISFADKKPMFANEKKKRIDTADKIDHFINSHLNIFSKEVIEELLNNSNSSIVSVETRNEVITLTSGEITLEFSAQCPPICFE